MNASTYCENKNFYSLLFQTSSEHFFSCQSCLDSSPYLHHHFDCSSYSTILTTLFSCWKTIEHSSHPTPQEKKYSTLKEGLREGEKKRKGKERCKSSLQQEVKAYTLKLSNSCWVTDADKWEVLDYWLPLECHFNHTTLKIFDKYDFQ